MSETFLATLGWAVLIVGSLLGCAVLVYAALLVRCDDVPTFGERAGRAWQAFRGPAT